MLILCYLVMQHKYHTKIDDLIEKTMVSMRTALVGKLISVLEKVLSSLGRYDEGNMMGSILSFAVRIVVRPDRGTASNHACPISEQTGQRQGEQWDRHGETVHDLRAEQHGPDCKEDNG